MNMRYSLDRYRAGPMKHLLLVALFVGLPFALVGGILVGLSGIVAGLLIAVAVMGVAYALSPRVVLRLCHATPVDETSHPALVQLVETLAATAGIRTPTVAISALSVPNAFAAATPG